MFNLGKKKEDLEKKVQVTKEIQSLDQKIEALLFFKGEEMSLNLMVKYLNAHKKEVKNSLEILKNRLEKTALVLVENNNSYLLTIKSDFSDLIEKITVKEETGELSKPALETLAIILYKGPITKAVVDEIRGINSSYILRNLLIRGLIERKKEETKNVYLPTMDLFRFLGIEKQEKLPAYQEVLEKLAKIEESALADDKLN